MRKELYILYPDTIESLTYEEVKDRDIVLKELFFGNAKLLNFIRELYLRFPSVQINSLSGRELEDVLDILLYQNHLPQISKTYKLIIKDIGCNARCPMCNDWKNKEDAVKLEESMFRAFQEIYDDNVSKKYVQILGGEPLLIYSSIKKILQLSGGAIEFDFPTNASLLSIAKIDELLSLGLGRFTFSLDFPSEKHDSWRSLPGVCDKIVTFTNYLRGRGIEVQWNTVVGKFNIDEISSFQDFYDSARPTMHNFICIDGYGGESSEYFLTGEEISQALYILEKLENGNKDIVFVRNGFFPGGTGDFINNLRKKNCFAPIKRKSFYITDSGYNRVPCYYENKKILDNLQEFTTLAMQGKCREKCDTSCGSAYITYLSEIFEKFQHTAREYEFPEDIMIEVTNVCNLECTTCYSHQDGREKKFMELSLFRKIIDEIPEKETRTVSLYNYGEPLMHPDIIEMVSYAKKSRVARVKISTNGHFLSPQISAGLITAGLDYLSISIDGTTQEVYEKFRKNGNLSTVLKNTLSLIQLKKKIGRGPIIEIQFIIMQHNEHQIPLIQKLAKKIGADILRLKTVLIKEKKWESLLPQDQKKSRYDKKLESVCFKPVKGIVVNVDGIVIPCCYMTDKWIGAYTSGNAVGENLQAIFRNSGAFLKKVTTDKTQIPYCDSCNEGNVVMDYEVIHFDTTK